MKLCVNTWFQNQSSDICTEVKDTILMDSCVISAQDHFTKNTDFFPIKIRNNFNGCPMIAIIRDGYGFVGTCYRNDKDYSGSDIKSLEMDLLRSILKQMNMTFVYVSTPEDFEIEE